MRKVGKEFLTQIWVDLSLPDQLYLARSRSPYIEQGGTFAGVVVPHGKTRITDNVKLTLRVNGLTAAASKAASASWSEEMIRRIRALLAVVRSTGGDITITPDEYRNV